MIGSCNSMNPVDFNQLGMWVFICIALFWAYWRLAND